MAIFAQASNQVQSPIVRADPPVLDPTESEMSTAYYILGAEAWIRAFLQIILACAIIPRFKKADGHAKKFLAIWFYLEIPDFVGYLPIAVRWVMTGQGQTENNDAWVKIMKVSPIWRWLLTILHICWYFA